MLKSPEHLANFTDLTEPISFASRGGEVTFSAVAEHGDTFTTVTTAIDHSSAVKRDDLYSHLTRDLEEGSPLDELVTSMRPGGEVDRLATGRRFRKAVAALGYIASVEMDSTLQGTTRINTSFTYPSTEALNGNARRLLPDTAVTFKGYDGNEYPPDEFLSGLAEDGTVLLAESVPYAVHDHAAHTVGWIAQGTKLVDAERHGIKNIQEFSNPSPQALDLAMAKLDVLTAKSTAALLYNVSPYMSRDAITHALRFELQAFWYMGRGNRFRDVPSNILGASGDTPTDTAANEMWDRMQAAEETAASEAA